MKLIEFKGSKRNGGYFPDNLDRLGKISTTTKIQKPSLIPQVDGGLTGGLKNVFELIKTNPGQNTKSISVEISKPEKTVEKWIKKLRELNLIEFRGSKKSGGYHMK